MTISDFHFDYQFQIDFFKVELLLFTIPESIPFPLALRMPGDVKTMPVSWQACEQIMSIKHGRCYGDFGGLIGK